MTSVSGLAVEPLTETHADEIVDALADAFHDYPVMRFVCGETEPYASRLHRLIELFVSNRVWRNESLFGIRDSNGTLIAAATTTRPDTPDAPKGLVRLRDEIWSELGAGCRERYDRFAAATQRTPVEALHHHLNMIGVRSSHRGRGLARPLLLAVQRLAEQDPASAGVSLTTELERNVALYRHFGYEVVGSSDVDASLRTWTLFRARAGSARPGTESELPVSNVQSIP
ncbi:MAG TPA: GNAT family N-acetyltransferase [Gemmatimonadaceae bacterium]|nr:GNAT family N-acetyltransferase [Gemmatimonadaceae bacterium]